MIFNDMLEGFTDEFARLYKEYDRVVEMLQASGFEPPPQFRQLTEFTMGRRFEREIATHRNSHDPLAYRNAIEIANQAAEHAYKIDKTGANETFAAMINELVSKTVERPSRSLTKAALDLIALARRLDIEPNLEPAQEQIYHAFLAGVPHAAQLARLTSALGLAHSAVRRHKTPDLAPAHDGVGASHTQAEKKHSATPRRRPPRPRTKDLPA
jgi:hypothetical protein